MNTPWTVNKQLHLRQWTEEWQRQMESGLSMKAWCETEHISYNTFRAHIKEVRDSFVAREAEKQSEIQPIPVETAMAEPAIPKLDIAQVHLEPAKPEIAQNQADIHIEFKNVVLDISNSADLEHIGYVLGAFLNVKF